MDGNVDGSGPVNSLAQKLVQLTMPGVPDVYQGTELWDDSLVHPTTDARLIRSTHPAAQSSATARQASTRRVRRSCGSLCRPFGCAVRGESQRLRRWSRALPHMIISSASIGAGRCAGHPTARRPRYTAMCLSSRTPPYDRRMRVLFLTGIWPPDVGGPATHGPDFARFLRDHGHDVRVVTMGDHEPTERPVPVRSICRGRPFVIRYPLCARGPQAGAARRRRLRDCDVRRCGRRGGEASSRRQAGVRSRLRARAAIRTVRRHAGGVRARRRAFGDRAQAASARFPATGRRIVVPSAYLGDRDQVGARSCLGRGAHQSGAGSARRRPRAARAQDARLRRPLTEQKALPVAFAALAHVADAQLVLVGDGPERARLEELANADGIAGRVTFAGRSRETRCCATSPAPPQRCCRAHGRTCRTPPSSRSRSAPPWWRPRSEACPRSCTTT